MQIDFHNVADVQRVLKDLLNVINTTLGYTTKNSKLTYDMLIFVEVLKKTRHDLEKFASDMDDKTPDLYKQYGVFVYWVKRLKPFNERSTKHQNYTNEIISFSFAFARINQFIDPSKRVKVVPSFFLTNIMYLIRFEQISKYGIIAIFSAMFETR